MALPPRPGMFATVRNRYGVIAAVEPYDAREEGTYHLVQMEYKDEHFPATETLLWEVEVNAKPLETNALPNTENDPMSPADFDAVLRAARWGATMPFLDPDGDGPLEALPLTSPFHGAFEVEDYQLVPLLKALAMPRVNLLIADDVGLGKTIEAGLILNELLLRRRIRRVLILTPASLRIQWQRDELWGKFNLNFDLVDRGETVDLKKRLGMDANPWRSFDKIISSYHYLRQPDVLDQFLAASQPDGVSPRLPWDLLIVDECHNLMPASFGEDSDLTKMLRTIAPLFEHKLFLSATPHNGHTRSFSGLLELMDPVRFSQTSEFKPAEKLRIKEVVIRRLKREINQRTNPPKFSERLAPRALALSLSPEEVQLSEAFGAFRTELKKLLGARNKQKQRTGSFAVEMLGKRLLSCPTAFAESWRRCKQGMLGADKASEGEVDAARKNMEQDTADDREAHVRAETAATVVGAWMRDIADELQVEIEAIDFALEELGFDLDGEAIATQNPTEDARFDSVVKLIDENLKANGKWRDDERLVIFTEYKTTLDYLLRRLRAHYESDRIITLYGGMDDNERDDVKTRFNTAHDSVRILVATDAAAEGLNLQRHSRYLLHFDCPWNPSRLEQRNGRIDRHGQPRPVTIHHFVSEQDHDLQFLARLLTKANDIREDLGSANELFDEAAHRRLVNGENMDAVVMDLDRRVAAVRGRSQVDADNTPIPEEEADKAGVQLTAMAAEMDLDSGSMRETLETALALQGGRPQLQCDATVHTCNLLRPDLPGWNEVVDHSLRRHQKGDVKGPLMRLAFGPEPFYETIGQRQVFHPKPDVQMMHLGHPMIQRATSALTRKRFPGTGEGVSRWCIREGQVPEGAQALVLLSVEEIAVNALRETFHHWVRTVAFPIVNGRLGAPLPHRTAMELRGGKSITDPSRIEAAREMIEDVGRELKSWLKTHGTYISEEVGKRLEEVGKEATKTEEARYRSRQGEVSAMISNTTMEKLNREIEALRVERQQGLLFGQAERFDQIDSSIAQKEEEVKRQKRQHEEVRDQLEKERERIVKQLLPKRHTMVGEVHVFPITLELQFPR